MATSSARIAATALLVLAGLILGGWLLGAGDAPRAGRPDVVIFVWDTCRADRLSAYGFPRPTTPRLEALAREGVLFRRAYAPAPWTPPSHASLFTGLLPSHHGLTLPNGPRARVRTGIPLLAETLAAAGYETVAFTSNSCISNATGLDAGFERVGPVHAGEPVKGSVGKTRRVLEEWLSSRPPAATPGPPRRPLFLFVNLMDAHLPRQPSEAAVAAVRDPAVTDADLAAARRIHEREAVQHSLGIRFLEEPVLAAARNLYDAACRELDEGTGGILDRLRDAGLLEDALVAITADHGESLGEHGDLGHRMAVTEELLRIPLVVRWPGRLDGGRVEEAEVGLQDLYPTILEAAGVPVPRGNGRDAVSLLSRPVRARPMLAAFDRAHESMEEVRSIFPGLPDATLARLTHTFLSATDPAAAPGARKYVRVLRPGEGDGALEREHLHDLAADPGETRNLLSPRAPPPERAAADRLADIVQSSR